MVNIEHTKELGITDSVECFLSHWKYGHNYEDSTILIDPLYNIIAFYDRKTNNIDAVMAGLPFQGDYIIGDGKKITINENVEYKPYDYEKAINKNKEIIAKFKKEKKRKKLKDLYTNIKKEIEEYNVNYFSSLSLKLNEGNEGE